MFDSVQMEVNGTIWATIDLLPQVMQVQDVIRRFLGKENATAKRGGIVWDDVGEFENFTPDSEATLLDPNFGFVQRLGYYATIEPPVSPETKKQICMENSVYNVHQKIKTKMCKPVTSQIGVS